jgi:type I restriction enzyme M protein
VTKTTVQKAYKGMDEDSENTKILKSWLDTNDAVATIKKEAKALTGSIEQSIQSKIEEDKTLDHIYELTIVNQYIQLRDAESKLKKQIKEKEQELDDTLYAKYPELTEEEIKLLVVNDKWLTNINNAISGEIEQVSQLLTNRIKELAERYDTTLPAINKLAEDLESTVNSHLEKMGFSWD